MQFNKALSKLFFFTLLTVATLNISTNAVDNKNSTQTAWAQEAIFYAVYVRSFHDSDGDGNGDLIGLTSKLDYITSLGANALLLMPIQDNDHDVYGGYAAINYNKIEKSYGGDQAWQTFLDEAHKRGLKVVLDISLTHVADSHPWFVNAKNSTTSKERNYFIWTNSPCPDNKNVFGGSAWTEIEEGSCYYATYDPTVPSLNPFHPELANKLHAIGQHWLQRGADGFRLDSAPHMAEINPANPSQQQPSSAHTHGFWQDFLTKMKISKASSIAVAEIFTLDLNTITPYYNDGIDMVFDYPLYLSLIDAWRKADTTNLAAAIDATVAARPSGRMGGIFLGNHDVPGEILQPYGRISDFLNGDHQRLTTAAMLLFSLPGTPFIYYGEEIGLTGAPAPRDGNPIWSRNPMQWNKNPGRGFTTNQPWAAFSTSDTNVADQDQVFGSLLETYRGLAKIRKSSPALTHGNYKTVNTTDPEVLAYIREDETETVLVTINLSEKNKRTNCNLNELGITSAIASDRIFNLPYPEITIHSNPPCL